VCLQETHCTYQTVEKWKKEWKNLGGGESTWNCGSSNTRGVGILEAQL
jgi:exonuclease III